MNRRQGEERGKGKPLRVGFFVLISQEGTIKIVHKNQPTKIF